MDEIKQGFFKGISRGQGRSEFSDPEYFYSVQNARLLQNSRIGEIVRINGYTKASTVLDSVDDIYDIIRFGDNAIAFYKTTTAQDGNDNYEFGISIFNSAGTEVDTFTYLDDNLPTTGKLKQYDDTIFIAPHNKIVYKVDTDSGIEFYVEDFISTTPKIATIANESPDANEAIYEITFNSTVSNLAAKPAKGLIFVFRNNIPQGTSETVTVTVGANTTTDITLDSSMSVQTIAETLRDAINNDGNISPNWSAILKSDQAISVVSNNNGDADNDTVIKVNTSTYTREDKGDGSGGGGNTGTNRDGGFREPVRESFISYQSDYLYRSSLTFSTLNAQGGKDASTFTGSIRAKLTDIDARPTSSVTIDGSDTTTTLASKVSTILNANEKISELYTIEVDNLSTNVINITAKNVGSKFNTDFIIESVENSFDIPSDFYSVVQQQEGTDVRLNGTLETETPYWYKARFKYLDGHITQTCSPKLKFTSSSNQYLILTFDVSGITDLDGSYPRIQLFRKEEGGNFNLIYEEDIDNAVADPVDVTTEPLSISGTTVTFVDQGFTTKDSFNEEVTIWSKSHKTEEVVENRLVKANIDFFDETYTVSDGDFTVTAETDNTNRDVSPIKSKVDVYVRPQYTDGTLGYFTEIDRVDIDGKNKKIQIDQSATLSAEEKTINDLRFYGKYLPYTQEQTKRFKTVEIQTPNLPTIEDSDLYPTQTKIFYGYKYISVWEDLNTKYGFIFTKGWDIETEDDGNLRYLGIVDDDTATINSKLKLLSDGRLQANIHGILKTYIPIAKKTGAVTQTVYKLEEYEALREAVSTGELYLKLSETNVSDLSSTVTDDTLLSSRARIIGVDDKSLNSNDEMKMFFDAPDIGEETFLWDFGGGTVKTSVKIYLYPSEDSRIYLTLDDEVFNEIDNEQINKYEYKRDSGGTKDLDENQLPIYEEGTVYFDLINFSEETPASGNGTGGVFDFTSPLEDTIQDIEFVKTVYDEAKYILVNRNVQFEDTLIYLGSKDNSISTNILETTGFRYERRTVLTYSILAQYNIYDSLITSDDFNYTRTNFENQLIWSSPLLTENYYAGGRNFGVENFYNIGTEYGQIIDIVALNSSLYAFCERGVAKLLIGETLTQQAGGNVVVNSSNFITRSIWILENLVDVKPQSIVKKDGSIYFTDGNDIYSINSNGITNISKGVLNLDSTIDYTITTVPKYDEIRVGDGTEMLIYNDKYQTWYGPFTYDAKKTIQLSDNILSYVDELVIEDSGNTFDGTSYETIIQSVGNDTQVGVIDKTYRKFYLSVEGDETDINPDAAITDNRVSDTTIEYGKDFNSMVSKSLSGWDATNGIAVVAYKNGWYHVGIQPDEGNTKKIYWDIKSTNDNFVLSGFVTAYMLRRRR